MRTVLIGAALLLAGTAALAQTTPPPGVSQGTTPVTAPVAPHSPEMRMRMHMMSDKVMTRDEVAAHVGRLFEHLDANRDGIVTREELDNVHQRMMGMHDRMERKVAESGMKAHDRGAAFDRLDTNHDGMISRQEFLAAKPHVEEHRVMVMRDGVAGHPPMEGMGMHRAGFGGHLFETADANHDGRVTVQEATNAALQHFDRADLNHDGKLTPEERQQAHQLMRGSRRPS